jgi:chitinase
MRKTILFSFIISILFSFAQNTNGQQFNKKIIGYYTSWSVYVRNYHVPDIPADKINYINYAFANIDNAAGTIKLGDYHADVDKWYPGDSWEPGALRGCFHQLQILKANNPHLKTFISVGGWTWSTYFSNIALTQQSREIFAASCVDFIQEY